MNLPTPDRDGVVSVFDEEGSGDTLFSSETDAHQQIVEQIVEMQDDLMTQYLEEGDRRQSRQAEAARRVRGRPPRCAPRAHLLLLSERPARASRHLLHVFASLLPNPLEGNPRPVLKREIEDGDEVEFHAEPDADKPLLAHVFKVTTDKHVGKLGVFRVHQGTVQRKERTDSSTTRRNPCASATSSSVRARRTKRSRRSGPGDIGAVVKLDRDALRRDAARRPRSRLAVHLAPAAAAQADLRVWRSS